MYNENNTQSSNNVNNVFVNVYNVVKVLKNRVVFTNLIQRARQNYTSSLPFYFSNETTHYVGMWWIIKNQDSGTCVQEWKF